MNAFQFSWFRQTALDIMYWYTPTFSSLVMYVIKWSIHLDVYSFCGYRCFLKYPKHCTDTGGYCEMDDKEQGVRG